MGERSYVDVARKRLGRNAPDGVEHGHRLPLERLHQRKDKLARVLRRNHLVNHFHLAGWLVSVLNHYNRLRIK
jgi:hypothetical protein